MQSSFQVDRRQVPAARSGTEQDAEKDTPQAHEKAAMLAEFNGTYELAQWHRDRAERLRRGAAEGAG